MPTPPLITPFNSLNTAKEYRHHRAHTWVGFYVILHFIYRYVLFFLSSYDDDIQNDMGFEELITSTSVEGKASLFSAHPYLFFILMCLPHLLLQLSGFGFRVPKKRHPDGNRIWPQYRFEAMTFFCRCMSLLFIAWHRKLVKRNNQGPQTSPRTIIFWNSIIVFATMIAADIVAKSYRLMSSGSSRTIRDLKGPPFILYLMSATQFHATLNSLMTKERLSVQFVALGVVQMSAFGMTLRRKAIITQKQGVTLYGFVLILGMIVIVNDLLVNDILFVAITLGNTAALFRFELKINKYFIWTSVIFLLSSSVDQHGYWTLNKSGEERLALYDDRQWFYPAIVSTIALFLGAVKRQPWSRID